MTPAKRDRIIAESMPKIMAQARKQYVPGSFLDEDDLIQEGVIGLLSALKRYKPTSVPPYGYAAQRVAGQMRDAKRNAMLLHRGSNGTIPKQPVIVEIDQAYQVGEQHGRHGHLDPALISRDPDQSTIDHLYAAMDRLRPTQRRLLEEIYFKEMDRKDLAKELGVKLEKLWWKEQNALRDLRKIMTAMGGGND